MDSARPDARPPLVPEPEPGPEPGQRDPVRTPFARTPPARTPPARSSPVTASLARVLDDLVTVPGTRYRVGLDPVIGVVPGVGDAVGTVVAGVVLVEAVRNRVPVRVLFRIGWNYLVDAALGTVPFVGDVADVAHKATSKNLRLVHDTIVSGRTIDTDARGYLLRAVGAVALMLGLLIALAGLALWGLLKLIGLF